MLLRVRRALPGIRHQQGEGNTHMTDDKYAVPPPVRQKGNHRMAGQRRPDPWQQDYERQKATGFAQPASAVTHQAPTSLPQATARPVASVSPRKFIIGALVVILVIIGAIVGHAIGSSNSIAVGDCVVTNPNLLSGWDIKKVACNSNPGTALVVQKVVSVQDGSSGQCDYGLTTFEDDPANKTYCLNDYSFGGG